ncbi:MAG: trypsin-like peptidase domain-containing protein [Phycisphaerales bacterium]|nr:MAG: trypsin-like peptidase domain-containing protein [Phycisphaerales bacterium]
MTKPVQSGRRIHLTAAAIALVLFPLLPVASADDGASYQRLIDSRADVIVTVRFVLNMKMGGAGGFGDQETESEIPGVMIDPDGLVLCSNTQFGGITGMIKRMMGSMPGFDLTAEPSDIKVLIGAEENELDAELVARDVELDLAWVQIKNDEKAKYKALDLADSTEVKIGQQIMAVRRLGKYFDRHPEVHTDTISAQVERPRKLWMTQYGLSASYGLPVFTSDNKFVGIVVLQAPDDDEGPGEFNPFAMMGSMSNMQDMFRGAILPAPKLVKATKRARELAKSQDED